MVLKSYISHQLASTVEIAMGLLGRERQVADLRGLLRNILRQCSKGRPVAHTTGELHEWPVHIGWRERLEGGSDGSQLVGGTARHRHSC